MQYHVPGGLINSPGNATSCPPTSKPPNPTSASPPLQTVSVDGGHQGVHPTGVAIGQGLLSGRRLAVRVAPPNATALPPAQNGGASHPYSASAPSGPPTMGHSDGVIHALPPNFAAHLQRSNMAFHAPPQAPSSLPSFSSTAGSTTQCEPLPPPSTLAPSSPLPSSAPPQQPQPALAASTYGGGIVRISDLRRQGVQSIESGLRLPTLQGGRPAAALPMARTDVSATTSARSSARGGRRQGRGARSSGGSGGRRSGRGSLEVTLTETGELCDYRWFTAGRRRCFVYDGKTYRGSAAHRMWAKVKEAASQRGRTAAVAATATQRGSSSSASAGASSAAARRGGRSGATTTTRNAPQHRTSARALAAADRSLHLENSMSLFPSSSSPLYPHESREPAGAPPLRDEWRDLMRELNVEGEGDLVTPAVAAQQTPHAAAARGHLFSGFQTASAIRDAALEVVEITDDSDDGSESGDDDTSSASSNAHHDLSTPDRRLASVSKATAETLQWPNTSFFSDESSGWSSTSSLDRRDESPSRKKVKLDGAAPHQEEQPNSPRLQTASQRDAKLFSGASSTGTGPQRRLLNGVEVVEEDGWVYPAEVYASQQEQRQKDQQQSTLNGKSGALLPSPLPRQSTESTLSAFGLDALQDVNDVPLSQLFTATRPHTTTTTTPALTENEEKRGQHDLLLRGALPLPPSRQAQATSAGIAVIVGGQSMAMPLRPASSSSSATSKGAAAAAVLRGVDDDDVLSGFAETEVADLFVTGEEIGGVRYGS